jgi:hypothetical protein
MLALKNHPKAIFLQVVAQDNPVRLVDIVTHNGLPASQLRRS